MKTEKSILTEVTQTIGERLTELRKVIKEFAPIPFGKEKLTKQQQDRLLRRK